MNEARGSDSKFDEYATRYDALWADSIRSSGESTQYFLQYKLERLRGLKLPKSLPVLDFGCGVGNLTQCLASYFENAEGYDPSLESIRVARSRFSGPRFHSAPASVPDGHFGAAVLSGVLHHVTPPERPNLLQLVRQKLAPGGKLIIFEHNPFNPLTRRAVEACPFDDDAELVWPHALRRLVRGAGFRDVQLDYIVFFPRALRVLRPLEPYLGRLFLGAQTMTVGTSGP
ncbi:MAG: class I SAM-dependent methyltransferase [Deltaproteobacteria bacterium]